MPLGTVVLFEVPLALVGVDLWSALRLGKSVLHIND